MRHGCREVEEEWPVLVRAHKGAALLRDEIGRVFRAGVWFVAGRRIGICVRGKLLVRGERWILQLDFVRIGPEVGRVEVVRHRLAVVAEEAVEALFVWIACAPHGAESPLPDATIRV